MLRKSIFKLFQNRNKDDLHDSQFAKDSLEQIQIPRHLAVIMDGNGRWASQRGLPRTAGHRAGAENLRTLCSLCGKRGIQYLTVYAFSTENWSRPKTEVQALMELFVEFFNRYERELEKEGVRVRFMGERTGLPDRVLNIMNRAEIHSIGRPNMQLIIAFNYGGRHEIVSACQKLAKAAAKGDQNPDQIDEVLFSSALYLPDVPDPDLIIRPSGEQRLSNFLLWQAAYSELWFSDVLWPDFKEEHLDAALADYTNRERRYGGLSKHKTESGAEK